MTPPAPGGLYRAYATLTALAAPALRLFVTRKLRAAGVEAGRIAERFGQPTEARPTGPLIWFHAVSVGESMSILGLIRDLGDRHPGAHFLITSVSATSARLIADRRPARTAHQFAPLDTPGAVAAFLAHWQPTLAVFVESELWPRLIIETHAKGIPLALINARLSERSHRRWAKMGASAKMLLTRFATLIAQTQPTADALIALGADPARISVSGDLKAASDHLPVDAADLARLKALIGDRPTWIAASTHPGEEEIVAEAHATDALLILAPRHPERGDAIADLLRAQGRRIAQRSKGEDPGTETQIYLADTLGELGLWFALSPIVFLGGSLTPVGGHNPFEPAQFGCAVLHGPHVANAAQTYETLTAKGAAREVKSAKQLTAALAALRDPTELEAMRTAARAFSRERLDIRKDVADRLDLLLNEPA
ncbi:MAG: 3-deoxy-D-manno-octulosonic acid transferase [Pseudomonadota bacterium]